MAFLECSRVVKDFGGLRALDNLDFEVEEGAIVGLIGPNGSGKTTLLNIITGLSEVSAGHILYKGEQITGLEPHQVAEKGVIRTFQITSLFSNLTAEENIIHGMYLKTNSSLWGSFFSTRGYRKEEARLAQKANEILALFDMGERRSILARNLSPAEQRNLEIGIALAGEPKLLLLDEPAAGLNPEESTRLVETIKSIHQGGITVVVVEHNMKVIMNLCTRVIVIDYGRKIAEGSPHEIAHNDEVISIYLGQGGKYA